MNQEFPVLRFQVGPQNCKLKGDAHFTFSSQGVVVKLRLHAPLRIAPCLCIFDVSVPRPCVILRRRSEDWYLFISRLKLAVFHSEERLVLPCLWVESRKAVTLHLDPAHLLADVCPSFLLEKGSSAQLCSIIGHIVEHVEEHTHREVFDS